MKYGLPWQGSKNAIAEWVVSVLPPSHTLVDLFAGGCAVTHAALLSGKWGRVIANDITDGPEVFANAAAGAYRDCWPVLTREEFNRTNDTLARIANSFKNDRRTYLYSKEVEPIKVEAGRMLTASTVQARRMHYRQFMRLLCDYVPRGRAEDLEALERLERVQALECLERVQGDYQDVAVPDGATVYADPPYKNTAGYGDGFNHERFATWLASVPFPVYVSEFTAPAGCVEVASRPRAVHCAANGSGRAIEKIFVQERFA